MTMPVQRGMNNSMNDPVTKAVVDNIMGNLPTKKPQVRCTDCNLDFTSEVVLEAHLQGARHAKQIRSKTILATLEQSNVPFSKDQETNGLKCNPCNVYLNSIQQLQTHLNGNRHKKKMTKGNWNGAEIISKSPMSDWPAGTIPKPAPQVTLLSCSPCNKFFNSESQLNAHLASQKHSDKVNKTVNGKKKNARKFFPYRRKGANNSNQTKPQPSTQKPLSNNFISAGYQNEHHTGSSIINSYTYS